MCYGSIINTAWPGEINVRGVPLAMGHGERVSDLNPKLKKEVEALYADAKICIRSEFTLEFMASIPHAVQVKTMSRDRDDYIAHPVTGEQLNIESIAALETLRGNWGKHIPDVQIVISDGLNANAIMDPDHLMPYIIALHKYLSGAGLVISDKNIVVIHGRVRAGYQIGNILFEKADPNSTKAVLHIIGERPGTIHRNYSVYMAAPKARAWTNKKVDHDIARVISGISDTSLEPIKAAEMTAAILKEMIFLGK